MKTLCLHCAAGRIRTFAFLFYRQSSYPGSSAFCCFLFCFLGMVFYIHAKSTKMYRWGKKDSHLQASIYEIDVRCNAKVTTFPRKVHAYFIKLFPHVFICDPDGIRTHNPLVKSQLLCRLELRGHKIKMSNNVKKRVT